MHAIFQEPPLNIASHKHLKWQHHWLKIMISWQHGTTQNFLAAAKHQEGGSPLIPRGARFLNEAWGAACWRQGLLMQCQCNYPAAALSIHGSSIQKFYGDPLP